jgi:1-acyl-sn-glycerol-3-phosphate acyltransferase
MNLIKNILGRVSALWAALLFVSSLIILFIPLWITGLWPEPKRTIYFIDLSRVWMKFFFVFSGVKRVIKGKENFKKGANYIIVCNHSSFMDVPLTSPGIPGGNKTIAKIEMARIPLFGIVYKRGSVLVNRKSEESRRISYQKMKEVLEMGLHMCIYPEGTRNKTTEPLQRFHDGAFRLATETGKNIVPALIFNTNKVLPAHTSFFFWPQKVEMHFLPEISVANKTKEDLKEEVFQVMKDYFVEHK